MDYRDEHSPSPSRLQASRSVESRHRTSTPPPAAPLQPPASPESRPRWDAAVFGRGVPVGANPIPKRRARAPVVQKRRCTCKGVWKLLHWSRHAMMWSLVLYFLVGGKGSVILEPVGRMLSSTALVGESAANAVSQFISSGTQIATASGNAVMASLDVARTAWRGVDLLSMNCTRTVGRVLAEDAYVLEFWLNSSHGQEVLRAKEPKAYDFWRALCRSLTWQMPFVTSKLDYLDVHGEFWAADAALSFTDDGYVAFEFQYDQVRFVPQWANPVWQWMDKDVTAEYQQVRDMIGDFISSVPATNASWNELVPQSGRQASFLERLRCYVRRWMVFTYFTLRQALTVSASVTKWGCGTLLLFVLGMFAFRMAWCKMVVRAS